jgi:NAD(P) transhydrogenase
MADTYDLIVIGSGPAGQSAAELAAFLGHSALIVEQGEPGGAVTTTGGAPTKTLREVALALAGDRRTAANDRGTRPLDDALGVLRTRTLAVCRSLQSGVRRQIAARKIAFVEGTARLSSDRQVVIDRSDGTQLSLTARAIVLATGSRPARAAGVPFDDPDIYDSNEIFTMQRLPDDIVIVGGGPVGVEFATILTALGVHVTLVDPGDRLLSNMDAELASVMADEFTRRGVTLILKARVESAVRRDGQLTVALSNGASINPAAVLFAAGRIPNTAGLGLDRAGVDTDRHGRIVVDRYYQTTSPGIYAVGDAVAPTLASIAMQQGRAAVCHALGLVFGVPVDRSASAAVYGLPELAGVGATEEETRQSGIPYVVGRADLSETARGAIAGRGGRLKLIVRADDRKLLGVHCIGDIASELVGMGHVVLQMNGPVDVFLTLALNTPTYSSAYRDAAIDAMEQLAVMAGRPAWTTPQSTALPLAAHHPIGAA